VTINDAAMARNDQRDRFDPGQSGENGYSIFLNLLTRYEEQLGKISAVAGELRTEVAVLSARLEALEKQLDAFTRGTETQGQRRFQSILQIVTWLVAIAAIAAGVLR
jgi:capsule polysaccharide export protein KpsE/RkpR